MSRFLVMVLGAGMLVIAGCRGNQNNIALASLNRSAKIQILCADVKLPGGNEFDFDGLLPSVLCTEDTSFDPMIEPRVLGAVTQVQTGEVAVVSFTGDLIFNTSRTIPGVTAFTVQEQPTGIQISPYAPGYTYVTSFSAKSVQAIPTEELLTGSSESPTPDPQRFNGGPTDLAMHEAALTGPTKNEAGEVTGAVSFVDYRYLYAPIPELGQVAQVEVLNVNGEQTLAEPVMLPLDTIACPVTMVPPPASDENDYNRICPENFEDRDDRRARVIKTVTTTEPCAEGGVTGPRPVWLAIDRGIEHGDGSSMDSGNAKDDVLLVADANQPVIHRFALGPGGATPLDPIITGTPTSEIDVTPLVPKSSDPDDVAATQRYLYAVSAIDSSILVVDYTDEGAPESSFGAVLPVIAGISARANEENTESRNRARFEFANVRAIEVVTPQYKLEDAEGGGKQVEADTICDPEDSNAFALAQSASNMRGVFLAVSLSSGVMYFLDIYDLNAPCRGGACSILAETGPDYLASIQRHRRRFDFTPSTLIEIDGTPSFQFNAAPGRLDEDNGDPISSGGPGLDLIECPPSMEVDDVRGTVSSMTPVFGTLPAGDDFDGLICASSQVWSSFSQRWDAKWEGLIPHSEGGLGLFADTNIAGTEDGNWFQGGDVPFCGIGVLGPQAPDADLVPSYVGDRLLITGELPPSTRDEPDCEEFRDLMDNIDDSPVWFPIRRAFNDELEIGESESEDYTLDEVRDCFPQFTEYQIHTQDAYTVTGTETGFVNRIVPDDNDECVLDPDRMVDPRNEEGVIDVDTYLTGRAFPGQQFVNPLVSFKIRDFPEGTTVTDSTVALLNFAVANRFRDLFLTTRVGIRSLPASMLFSPQQGQLFFVDFEAGVRQIVFSPLSIIQSFE